MSQQTSRKDLVKLIHTAQRVLGMDEDSYRGMLASLTGCRSCGDRRMTEAKLRTVLSHMRKLGFAVMAKAEPPATQAQRGFIRHLWDRLYEIGKIDLNSMSGLDAYCRRMQRESLTGLSKDQATRLIQSMKEWLDRDTDPVHVAALENMLTGAAHVIQ